MDVRNNPGKILVGEPKRDYLAVHTRQMAHM